MKYSKKFNFLFLIFGILCLLYYLGMGLAVRFGQSLLWLWPVVGVGCIVRYLLVRRCIRTGKALPVPTGVIRAFRACVIFCVAVFLTVEGFICANAFPEPREGLDAIIVLGARVNGDVPSGALSQRIAAAGQYLLDNPDTVAVLSGGRGSGENMTEALCMKEHLEYMGIAPERMILEERSTDTRTNFENSLPLLPEGTESVGIVTNDFHLFRALANARKLSELDFSGISARSTAYGYAHYAMREFFALGEGVLKSELLF